MERYQPIAAALIIAFALWVVWMALKLQYYTPLGPGAGFFAVWLGVILAVLAATILVQSWRRPATNLEAASGDTALPDRSGMVRVGSILGSLLLTGLLLNLFGFQLTVFVLLMFLLMGLERTRPALALTLALVFSVGFYQLLTRYLDVELPAASIPALAHLGF